MSLDTSRKVITRNESPDISFDRSINPYRGCEHGCSYCFARPTHAYMGLSPGLDFETKLFAKPNAAALLRAVAAGEAATARKAMHVHLQASHDRFAAALEEPVSQSMTRKVSTCTENETIASLMERMTEGKFRHLPVVDQGRLVGIVSIGDVVKHRLQQMESEQSALRDYIQTADRKSVV